MHILHVKAGRLTGLGGRLRLAYFAHEEHVFGSNLKGLGVVVVVGGGGGVYRAVS